MNSQLKIRLDRIVNDLAKTDGIDGSLIVDGNGEVLSHHLLQDVDIQLFGPMANVITGSSKRLTNFSNQGEIERILVESKKGKALFLHLGNVHFIVLMKNKANVGMIMISSKRAGDEIIDLTKDLTPIQLEEQITGEEVAEEAEPVEIEEEKPVEIPVEEPEIPTEKPVEITEKEPEKPVEKPVEITVEESVKEVDKIPAKDEISEPLKDTQLSEKEIKPEDVTEPIEEITEPTKTSEITASTETEPTKTTVPSTESPEVKETAIEEKAEEAIEVISDSSEIAKEEEKTGVIPVIRPPITFPKLNKITEIPEDQSERVDLLLKIYESIFLAMSIGASKIMGVAPARGLTRKFLPVEDCKTLLDGVDVKNNSAIDFVKIKENADKIPLEDREKIFKESFGKIITIITENYGKVMGYAAFRAMIRPEFKIINESYGNLLDELGVKEQLHPELRDFFN